MVSIAMKDPTPAPFYATLYVGLCDVARSHGYALAIHGSMTRDMDLIACPWTDKAVSSEELKDALMKHVNAFDYEGYLRSVLDDEETIQGILEKSAAEKEEKPHGRVAWNLYLMHGLQLDLSVMPRREDSA